MNTRNFLLIVLLCTAPLAHAASPSSVAANNGIKPSTISTNGGFDFKVRDEGKHNGWCKGNGHLAAPGNQASGHRNHWDCNTEDIDYCTANPDDVECPQ